MIITVGGIKGGTGKSTTAFHIATMAFLAGKKIATIDFDFPQFSFSRYLENRKKNAKLKSWEEHYKIQDISKLPEFDINTIYIIDTPGRYDENIKKLHAIADIIVTPVNDSFLDLDTIMQVQQDKWILPGYYCEMLFENRKHKPNSKWIIMRNRSTNINSKHKTNIADKLQELSKKLNFEINQGLKERTVYKEMFNTGETVLDLQKLTISHIAAKMEIKLLWKQITETN